MRLVAVAIRSAGDQQAVVLGGGEVSRRRRLVLIGVIGLERIDALRHEVRNPFIVSDERGMGEGGKASGVVDAGEYGLGRRAGARYERRPSAREKLIEGLVHRLDVAGRDQRPRNPGPPDGFR